jgi:DNA (cytosine-5)-methyltransferase 1
MTALYNEIGPFPARWLENLIAADLIATGRVDARSVEELRAIDLRDCNQFHAFAGIGVWSHALRLAGIPDSFEVWTGSCPCQPFSNAGRRKGTDDDRHLWPEWLRLIEQCGPPIIFGEQVASRAGRDWLSNVRADLEALGYAVGASDLCAAGAGAPHIRQRLYFGAVRLADSGSERRQQISRGPSEDENPDGRAGRNVGEANSDHIASSDGKSRGVGDTNSARPQGWNLGGDSPDQRIAGGDGMASWVRCSDGRARPIEPGTFPLAPRTPNHVGRLRAYGNAIVPQVAALFVRSFLDAVGACYEPEPGADCHAQLPFNF